MAINSKKFKNSIQIEPKASPSLTEQGDIGFNSTSDKVVYRDGAATREVVNTDSAQTLTNKTLTAPAISSPTGLVKADVGLSNVDNTSDATKDAAVATLTNKTLTAPVINSPTGLVKADVGLGNVDNTSDATKNSASVTLTNKTIDADANTITNIENADIKSGAAIDASKLADGSVSNAEFQYLGGVTSDIQTQLNDKIDDSEKGANNGVATLDAGGKIPASQLPNTVMEFKGTYDASTNTPTLVNGTGNSGDVYLVSVAGTQDFGAGNITFAVGDWVLYSGAIWEKSVNSNSVVSVNGQQGVVVLDTDDIAEGTALYFTDERAQDAVGAILTDTSSVDLVYNDGAGTIEATVLPAGVDHDALQNYVANEHIDHSAISVSAGAGLSGGGTIDGNVSISMPNVGTPGSEGSASETLSITTDAQGRVSAVSATPIVIASGQISDFDEAVHDAVGATLTNTTSVSLVYNDAADSISATVLPAGVDHDSLLNYVADQHIDHTSVTLTAGGGLSGGGDISANRTFTVDPSDATLVTAALGDEILVADASDSGALKKVTVQTIVDLASSGGSPGDISETSFAGSNNQASPANVTGLSFNPAVVRSFDALISVKVDAAADLFESFKLLGIQRGSDFVMSIESTGDASLVNFEITSGGQVQYTSGNYAGFASLEIKFRAVTTSV